MKRDKNLIKQILKYVEAHGPSERGFLPYPEIEGFDDPTIEYHVRLCSNGGLVRTNRSGYPTELTWAGHDVLDSLRDGNEVC